MEQLYEDRRCYAECAVLFETAEIQRYNRHLRIFFVESLSEKVDIIRGTAAAAGLGDEECGLVDVVLAAVEGVHELSDNEQSRIAGVIVDVFQSLVNYGTGIVLEELHAEALR